MVQVEGWPALMSTEMATRYLSVEEASFIELVKRFATPVVELEDGSVRWRRQDLDGLIRKLPLASPRFAGSAEARLVRLEKSQLDAIADAVALRLQRQPAISDRKLVSIKEAGAMLGLGRSSVYRMIEDGRLATTRIGRRNLVHVDAINAIIDSV